MSHEILMFVYLQEGWINGKKANEVAVSFCH